MNNDKMKLLSPETFGVSPKIPIVKYLLHSYTK